MGDYQLLQQQLQMMEGRLMGRLDDMQLKMGQQQQELLIATSNAVTAMQEEVRKGNREVLAAVGQVVSCSSSLQRQLLDLSLAVERQEELDSAKMEAFQKEVRDRVQLLHDSCTSNPALQEMATSLQQLQQTVQDDRCTPQPLLPGAPLMPLNVLQCKQTG